MTNIKGDTPVIAAVSGLPADATIAITTDGLPVSESQPAARTGDSAPALFEARTLRTSNIRHERGRRLERRGSNRGAAAHGVFKLYESQSEFTKAVFLQDPGVTTPVYVRFSSGVGSRGATDCARDLRGFAVRFYTAQGGFDLVGSNIPVFYIQDATKFADLVHAVKPELHNEAAQTFSGYDTFWDFIATSPESMHTVMWAMSDRALPRSFAMMEGFGVHSFRFVNAQGKSCFVKFHWKPLLGVHSLLWDEATKLAAKDAHFHRRHIWELIDQGHFPEWELGVQIVAEEDQHKFDFDLLDATKLIPESLVPVRMIGKLTLNRNPHETFDDAEAVAFHPEHLVPGIEFSDDPLLKRFSHSDVLMSRLCSTHFNELPANPSRMMLDNSALDAQARLLLKNDHGAHGIDANDSLSPPPPMWQANEHNIFPGVISTEKTSANSGLFGDHYSQPSLFWRSQSVWEQNHIVAAFCFELAKVNVPAIRERIVSNLLLVDDTLAARVAEGLGIVLPSKPVNENTTPINSAPLVDASLSMAHTRKDAIVGRCVAVLVANGFEAERLLALRETLIAGGASLKIISSRLGEVKCSQGRPLQVDHSLATVGSVMFDAVYIPGGARSVEALCKDGKAVFFVKEAYKHCKGIAASNEGGMLITRAARSSVMTDSFKGPGVISAGPTIATDEFVQRFIEAIAYHRFNERPDLDAIVA